MINNGKSCISDPVLSSLVKYRLDVISPLVTDIIIKVSLSQGRVPKSFKRAATSPLVGKHNLAVQFFF